MAQHHHFWVVFGMQAPCGGDMCIEPKMIKNTKSVCRVHNMPCLLCSVLCGHRGRSV